MSKVSNKLLFNKLYEQYYPMVQQMCLGYLKGDIDLAKDLAQEVFICIWNALDSFREKSKYKTWIYRITVNTCLKYLRYRKQLVNISIDEVRDIKDHEGEADLQPQQQLSHHNWSL